MAASQPPEPVLAYLRICKQMDESKTKHKQELITLEKKLKKFEGGVMEWLQTQPDATYPIPKLNPSEEQVYGRPGKLKFREVVRRETVTAKRATVSLFGFLQQIRDHFSASSQQDEKLLQIAHAAAQFIWNSRGITSRKVGVVRTSSGKRNRGLNIQKLHQLATSSSRNTKT